MDFRFDAEDRGLIAEAGASFRRRLPLERLLAPTDSLAAWKAVDSDGWLDVASGDADGQLSLALTAGIGREAGRVAAGDGFVSNALLIRPVRQTEPGDALLPGFLVSNGKIAGDQATSEARPWSFGVEKGLVPYRLDADGRLTCFSPEDWHLETVFHLAPQVVTATRVGAADGTDVGTHDHDEVTSLTRARVVHAGTLVGLGEAMNADAIRYAKQRVQFGGPIGRFQAIKHLLAESTIALEVAWNAVLYAALRPAETTADVAQLQAQRAVDLTSRTATQVFGGIAITWEHHLHLLVKSAQTSRMRFGGFDRIAGRLGARFIKEGSLA